MAEITAIRHHRYYAERRLRDLTCGEGDYGYFHLLVQFVHRQVLRYFLLVKRQGLFFSPHSVINFDADISNRERNLQGVMVISDAISKAILPEG